MACRSKLESSCTVLHDHRTSTDFRPDCAHFYPNSVSRCPYNETRRIFLNDHHFSLSSRTLVKVLTLLNFLSVLLLLMFGNEQIAFANSELGSLTFCIRLEIFFANRRDFHSNLLSERWLWEQKFMVRHFVVSKTPCASSLFGLGRPSCSPYIVASSSCGHIGVLMPLTP